MLKNSWIIKIKNYKLELTIVGDVKSAVEELKSKGVTVHRDIVERDAGKNAIVLDPDGYLVSLFEPDFSDKSQQTGGYHGFTPA